MKTFAALSAAFLLVAFLACSTEAVISDRLRMFVRPRMIECAHEIGIPDSELQQLIVNDLDTHSDGMEKVCLCFYQAVGMVDSQANILPVSTAVKFSLGDSPIRSIRAVYECRKIRGSSAQQQAWLINKCFVDQGLL